MCGIFGVVFLEEGAANSVDVHAALDAIKHRGPDDRGIWRDPAAGQAGGAGGGRTILGHVRLSIIDLSSAGHQPMVSPDGAVAVVFNGEIYNHHALRRELEGKGVTFRSRSDTEVIVQGYRVWGDAVIERLDGMFAIALYDAKKRRVLLARDRAGKKPLFYSRVGGALWLASEAKALFAAGLEPEVDVNALPMALALGYTPAPWTMYRGVKQLPPASMMTMEEGSLPRIREYWRIPVAESGLVGDAKARVAPSDAIARVRTLVEEAVERRLEADVPLGAFLSGGVDSTIVVGVMARAMGGRKVKTFSIGFAGDARYDETHYARIASHAFDTEHTEFILKPSAFDLVERLVEMHDGPFGDPSAVPTSVVSMLTREHVTVALSGDGGDELFCGYPRFLAAEMSERVPGPIRRAAAYAASALPRGASDRSWPARARRLADTASRPLADRLFGWGSYFDASLGAVLRPELRARLNLDVPRVWNRAMLARHSGTTLSRVLAHNFETYLPYDLLIKADRASMLHSLEVRSPFLDTALAEYVSRLPDAMKRRGTTTKWVLRRAFDDLLPSEIQARGKMGFGMPLATWFRGDLKSYVVDRFAPSSEMFEYLDRAHVERMLAVHFSGKVDHSSQIWLLLTLQVWLRGLADRRRRAPRESVPSVASL